MQKSSQKRESAQKVQNNVENLSEKKIQVERQKTKTIVHFDTNSAPYKIIIIIMNVNAFVVINFCSFVCFSCRTA